jgi:tetratricopeptide (TPR) repeat protein
MRKIHKIVLIITFLVSYLAAAAQTPPPSPEAQAAQALWQAQKWDESVKAYQSLTKNEPNNGIAWLRLGSSLLSLNKFNEAAMPLEKAGEILKGPNAYYALGEVYARLNDKEKAFEYLNKAAGVGFAQFNRFENDPHLAGIRDDPRFKALFESVEKNARPCKYMPEARQLDFWVGEWNAQVNGQTVGKSIIQRLEEGCLIMENWTGNGGSTGKSMNYYDPASKKWRQSYISNGQVVWEMSGEYKEGAMRYEGEVHSATGSIKTRVIFYNLGPDKVRHTEDNSGDGGKTWSNVWDATYVRAKPDSARQ